jgi:hypothetical protein
MVLKMQEGLASWWLAPEEAFEAVLLSGVTDVCKEVSFGGLVCLDALWELLWSGLKGFCCGFLFGASL